MKAKELRDLYSAAPFQPFEIVLGNGTRVLVDHPEFMSFSRDYRTVHVYERDGSGKRIDVKLVIALNELSRPGKNGSSRKRKP
ncbi:MAG: hypothetical protein H0V56_04495 [Chthoniobacterales bacterium]|nr:hypothetical protein [Chthoniobacterales bacterium]